MTYRPLEMNAQFYFHASKPKHILIRESKPSNSEFYQNDFLSTLDTNYMAHILSNFHSSGPIRTPFKSIYHVSKYCSWVRYDYLGDHIVFYRGRMLYHDKDAQNVLTRVKLFIICSKCHSSRETLHNMLKKL